MSARWGALPLVSARQMVLHLRRPAARRRPLVGLDVGRAFVGVAVSDADCAVAAPHSVLRIRNDRSASPTTPLPRPAPI